MSKVNFLSTLLIFYLGWFGCVLLAKNEYSLITLAFPLLLICFLFFKKLINFKVIIVALALVFTGIIFDSLLASLGFIKFMGQIGHIIPVWLISIWFLFSFSMLKLGRSFNVSLSLAALLGFIFGPLSYKSGEAFQVLLFLKSSTFWLYAILWAIIFPVVLHLSKRLS